MSAEIVQYIVVNQELEMSPGKIAAQVAHAGLLIGMRQIQEESLEFVSTPGEAF